MTGLGGLITLPVATPANIASVTYVQIRMIAAIAHMRGYDLKDDQVKTFVFVCLTGQLSFAQEYIKTGWNQSRNCNYKTGYKKIPGEIVKAINKAVGFRLVTKFGEKRYSQFKGRLTFSRRFCWRNSRWHRYKCHWKDS